MFCLLLVTLYFLLLGRSPKLMPVLLSAKYKLISVGCPIILQCEVSDPLAQVSWFKDEVELFCKTGLDMKRDGRFRKLMIHSAKVSDSGLYSCSLSDEVVVFHVDVEGDFLCIQNILRRHSYNISCARWFFNGSSL